MTLKIMLDALRRPDLFHWNGPPDNTALTNWMRALKRNLPADLVQFWQLTGGGEAFETECLLGPFGERRMGDDVDGVNEDFYSRGLSREYLVFHVGHCLSAIRQPKPAYASLDPESFLVTAEYETFDSWYVGEIRGEYSERYRLDRVR